MFALSGAGILYFYVEYLTCARGFMYQSFVFGFIDWKDRR